MKVLIIEDDRDIARQLSTHLTEMGFITHVVHDGEEGLHYGLEEGYDAVLLDVGLPQMDGVTILERWREAGRTMPVIIVSARTRKMETIRGLEAGADDYIYKPFDMQELIARIQSNIRRHTGQLNHIIRYQNVVFDTRAERLYVDDLYVKLTRTEFRMARYLFMHQGRPVSVTELSEHVYEDFDHDSSIIARHIANIRKKIGEDIILTESNRGYYVPKENR